jgi:Fe-S cluster biogenesis protein NfuA
MNQGSLHDRIELALAEIRPFLQNDGGDISLISVEQEKVVVRLEGACVDCSVNQMTLKSGVAMTIQKFAPEIKEVVNI